MNTRISLFRLALSFFIVLAIISNVSAIKVDPVVPSLAPQIDEGAKVNFTLKIKELDQRDADHLKIETNLVKSDNLPIFDFGDLNEYVDNNRYQQVLDLNLSSLPQEKMITVTISGQAPTGEIADKVRDDLVLSKFLDGDLKYYEVDNGKNVVKIEAFKLNIQKKEKFEETIQKINLTEFSSLKQDVRELFNIGLVTEAQNMATEMSEIKLPADNLKLFNIISVKSDFSLNIVAIGSLLFGVILGYVLRMKTTELNEE